MSLRTRLGLIMLAAAIPLVGGWLWMRSAAARANLDEALEEFATVHMQAGGRARCEEEPERFAVSLGPRLPPTGPDADRPRPPPDERPRRGERRPDDDRPFRPRGPRGGRRGPKGGRMPPRIDDEGPRPGPPRRHDGEGRRRGPPRRGRVERRLDPRRRTDMWAYDATFTSANPDAPPMPEELKQRLGTDGTSAGMDWADGALEGRQLAVRLPWPDGPCAFALARRPFPPDSQLSTRTLFWGAVLLAGGLLVAMLLAIGPILRRVRRLTDGVEASALAQYGVDVDVRGNDEIAGLARAFNDAGHRVRSQMQDLEERERTLRAFVANTTHDVMVPLTVLQGHLVALRKAVDDGDRATAALVSSGLEEAHYIACLVQNLSTMAKLEAGEVHPDEHDVDLAELVRRVVARHQPLADERGVSLDTVLPPESVVIRADITLLEQAVSNVVHNAVRYNRSGGRVLAVLEARAGSGRFRLRVIDDGPGVTDEELARLTERNFRGRAARTRRPDGGGLGLHITHDVVERHGMRLDVQHGEGGGLDVAFEGRLAPA